VKSLLLRSPKVTILLPSLGLSHRFPIPKTRSVSFLWVETVDQTGGVAEAFDSFFEPALAFA
jgi:hypothetical protein